MSTRTLTGHAPLAGAPRALARWAARHREQLWVVALLLLAAAAHAVNMFSFPYYESDEGTYMSQAYAVAHLGELAPYTYWYDHAPAGWIQIAGWALLSGGFHTFGGSINAGRVLMLLMHTGSALMVYLITRAALRGDEGPRPRGRRLWAAPATVAASVAVLSYAVSVYGLYYGRRVLLDNIAAFWMLLSLALLLHGRLTLTKVWGSAAALGVSILSKELTVFLVPVVLALVWQRSHPSQRWLASAGWAMIMGSVVSLYVLMALLKGELFPSGTLLGGSHEHVSLVETLLFHSSRGKDGGIREAGSNFWIAVAQWRESEPLLLYGGTAAMAACILALPWRRSAGMLGLCALMLWLFLGRGGIVFDFYLVPLLPLLAICLGVATGLLAGALRALLARPARGRLAPLWLAAPALVLAAGAPLTVRSYSGPAHGMLEDPMALWASPQADVQHLAVEWAQRNIAPDSTIVIDQAMWLDLRDDTGGVPAFPNAHYYWKVDKDPEIFEDVFGGERDSADYIITTPQLRKDVGSDALPLVAEILVHSTLVRRFDTGGWPVEVREVHRLYPETTAEQVLARTWETYKGRFVEEGRVVDPGRGGDTTSEGQSYALLRAVYMDDRASFDAVWGWTQSNLQRPDGLLAWLYGSRDGAAPAVVDEGTASDADQDTALALLLASRRWGEPAYQAEAQRILDGIWEQETAVVDGKLVLVAGDWARGGEGQLPVVNPSYFAPYAYRIFEQADPARPWGALADSSYDLLQSFTTDDRLGARTGLVPTWVALDPDTGAASIAPTMDGPDNFGYDGLRAPWRITLDWLWFREERAQEALLRFRGLGERFAEEGRLSAVYGVQGEERAGHESVAMYAGVMPALLFAGDRGAWAMFDHGLRSRYVDGPEGAYWGDAGNYYDQNWAWFTTALLDGAMGNLWAGDERLDWSGVIIE